MRRLSLLALLATLTPSAAFADPTEPPPDYGDPDYCSTLTAPAALLVRAHLLSPLSTARATTRRPTLRWESCAGARVEVCADRECNTVLTSADVNAKEWTPSSDLTGNGNVYFWRVKNRIGTTIGVSSVVWEVVVPAVSASHATWGGSVLDSDLDGEPEWLVGDYNDQGRRVANAGAVYVYEYWRNTGTPIQTLAQPDPGSGSLFGAAVSNAGDINGDGFADAVVGANYADDGVNTGVGGAYVFFGTDAGFDSDATEVYGGSGSAFGFSVSGAGDVNGDGYGDLLVGSPGSGFFKGEAYLYYGRHGATTSLGTPTVLTGSGVGGTGFGSNVAGVGDLNGDGYGDIAVGENFPNFYNGSHPEGRVFVWYGGPSGISGAGVEVVSPDSAPGDGFGYTISDAGDLDGDGYFDLVVGAAGTDGHDGAVHIWYGGPSGVNAGLPDDSIYPSSPVQGFFGYAVSIAGDLDGDGVDDLLIGETDSAGLDGTVYMHLSSAAGVTVVSNPNASAGGYFGHELVIIGDADRDGKSDYVVGADGAAWFFGSDASSATALGPTSSGFGWVGR